MNCRFLVNRWKTITFRKKSTGPRILEGPKSLQMSQVCARHKKLTPDGLQAKSHLANEWYRINRIFCCSELMTFQSVAVLGMRNGTSQSPFRPALGRQLVRAADAPLRGHGFGTSRLRQTPTTNGLTAYRMRLHLACVSSGTYGPFATSASRSRLRLPRTTRLALRASLAGSGWWPCLMSEPRPQSSSSEPIAPLPWSLTGNPMDRFKFLRADKPFGRKEGQLWYKHWKRQ